MTVLCEKGVKHDYFYVERVQSGASGAFNIVVIYPIKSGIYTYRYIYIYIYIYIISAHYSASQPII